MTDQLVSMRDKVNINQKTTYAKPDYDDTKLVTYDVTFRNLLGIKLGKIFTISYYRLAITLSEPDNGKEVLKIPAYNVKMAIPSEHVDTQVTILTYGMPKDCYKVWVDDDQKAKVRCIIRDVNKLVELFQDRLVE